jgi:magnesium chelatase subunit H
MKVTVLYVGASLLAPLKKAEAEINERFGFGLGIAAHNCGAALPLDDWLAAERDILESDLLFIIHVTDDENAALIGAALDKSTTLPAATIAFNCMPALMRRTRMGKLDFSALMKPRVKAEGPEDSASGAGLARRLASWMAESMGRRRQRGAADGGLATGKGRGGYVELIGRLPAILKLLPAAGRLKDIKHYIILFAYFLQPTPRNIRAMLLYAIKHYAPGRHEIGRIPSPESLPGVGVYHPDARALFEDFQSYEDWYRRRGRRLEPDSTIGLLLMRPQIVSGARRHYDGLIRAIEAEGLSVIPAISTFMDNREASRTFLAQNGKSNGLQPRVSQIVSLTGFSFVGGPAMNDSEAAAEFLRELDVPFRSMVSLDVQTIENWETSRLGLNPVQTAMQVAIPEIDGATEPFIFGGMTQQGDQPEPIDDRCKRIARRLARWNRLRTAPAGEIKLALLVFCFPPNKGNIGTAADLDVFPSLMGVLEALKASGYSVAVPAGADELREMVLQGNAEDEGALANVAYRMSVDEYRRLCPYVDDIEREWGPAPGLINSNGGEVLILGLQLGNVFVGVQPTFGYEGDPMRMLAAESGAPHHGFMGLYTYLERVFNADAVIHVGTHGSLEFMPGKQAGLSGSCWPDRLIGEMPHIYLYSVNNPSEGTIARRRAYAELVSYLTPPIENAGLYRELSALKELILAYRRSDSESDKESLFEAIEEKAREISL